MGVEAARAAGMSVIAVPDPHLEEDIFSSADAVIRSLEQFDPSAWGLPSFP